MALNKLIGEQVDGVHGPFRVVPNTKWRETPLFEQAANEAAMAFQRQGALLPITFDDDELVTQEYPRTRQLVMVFSKTIRQAEHYYPYVFDLPHSMIKELRANGRWENIEEH